MIVRSRLSLFVATVVFIALGTSAAMAQVDKPELSRRGEDKSEDKSILGSIRGRVLMTDGSYVNTNVRVTLQTLRETIAIIYTDSQGQFEFPDLIPGNYQIEIDPTDREHFEPSNEAVQVFRAVPSVVALTLKTREAPKAKTTVGTVSVSELAREVPAGARKEFQKATQASQKGQVEEAISHLRKAIEISPNFVMAYNDLGAQLLSQGRLDEAAESLQHAVTLDSRAFNPALNYGIVLVHLHRFPEAIESLSRALSLQPNSAAARLYSGLAYQGLGSTNEAAQALKAAYETGGNDYAIALFHLGEIYLNEGDRSLSLQYLEKYLAVVPNAANADQARRMIAMLR